jgi:hypothetical protein
MAQSLSRRFALRLRQLKFPPSETRPHGRTPNCQFALQNVTNRFDRAALSDAIPAAVVLTNPKMSSPLAKYLVIAPHPTLHPPTPLQRIVVVQFRALVIRLYHPAVSYK